MILLCMFLLEETIKSKEERGDIHESGGGDRSGTPPLFISPLAEAVGLASKGTSVKH